MNWLFTKENYTLEFSYTATFTLTVLQNMNHTIKTYLVWICMWIADLIPWVSWWTIAFIAGIYEKLLTSIHHIDREFIEKIRRRDIQWAWKHIQWNFLITLILWMLTAIIVWASWLEIILETHPIEVFSLFSWLIIASIVRFFFKYWSLRGLWYFIAWWLVWILITSVLQFTLPTTLWWYFIWWVLWSSAMILPWISGSYILLIVWMYEPVLELISWFTSWDMSTVFPLVALGLWVVIWLIALWRVLKWIYTTYPSQLILAMTWLMAWALPSILPTVDLTIAPIGTVFTVIGLGVLWACLFALLSLFWKNTSNHESV